MSRIISDAEIWVSGYNSITKQQPSVFKLKGNALSLECNQEHAHHFVWHSRGCAPWSRDRIVPKFYFNVQKTTNLNCWHQVHWKWFLWVFFLHPQSEIKSVWAHWIRSQTYWVTSACGDFQGVIGNEQPCWKATLKGRNWNHVWSSLILWT